MRHVLSNEQTSLDRVRGRVTLPFILQKQA